MVLAPPTAGWQEFDAQQTFPIRRWSGFLGQVPVVKRFLHLTLPFFYALALYHQQAFDWIECGQALPFGLIALCFKKALGVPYLVWAYGNDILKPQRYPFLKGLLHVILGNADALVAVSQGTKRKIVQLGLDPEKVTVIHPSVDTRRFHSQNDSSAVMARHHLPGKRVILTVTRLVERKGVDMVIRAMPRITESIPNAVYLIVGAGSHQEKLEELTKKLEVGEKVVFVGQVSDEELPCYYSACDVFALISRTLVDQGEMEGFGIVYLEAGACGKPVIAGRGGGASEAVQDGVTGLLVDPSDVGEIANAVVRVLKNEKLAKRLGDNGRKKAMQQPNWALLGQIPA